LPPLFSWANTKRWGCSAFGKLDFPEFKDDRLISRISFIMLSDIKEAVAADLNPGDRASSSITAEFHIPVCPGSKKV
jgi:hypothetical protein